MSFDDVIPWICLNCGSKDVTELGEGWQECNICHYKHNYNIDYTSQFEKEDALKKFLTETFGGCNGHHNYLKDDKLSKKVFSIISAADERKVIDSNLALLDAYRGTKLENEHPIEGGHNDTLGGFGETWSGTVRGYYVSVDLEEISESARSSGIDYESLVCFTVLHELMHRVMYVEGQDDIVNKRRDFWRGSQLKSCLQKKEECIASSFALKILEATDKPCFQDALKFVASQGGEYGAAARVYAQDLSAQAWIEEKKQCIACIESREDCPDLIAWVKENI